MDEGKTIKHQCRAIAKGTGLRCKRSAATGAVVCVKHGAGAPQVRGAGKRRQAQQQAVAEAQRMVRLAGVDMDPIDHLLESLQLAHQLVLVWGSMVAAMDAAAEEEQVAAGELRGELHYREAPIQSPDELRVYTGDRLLAFNYRGEAGIHPFVVEYQQAIDRRAKFAKLCLDAGVAERQTRLVEAQVDMTQKAFEASLAALGLDQAKRQEARREFARHLRLAG